MGPHRISRSFSIGSSFPTPFISKTNLKRSNSVINLHSTSSSQITLPNTSNSFANDNDDGAFSKKFRWLVLFLSCWIMFGNYYAYDNPSALNLPLQKWMPFTGPLFNYWLSLCYSVYSFPNIILPLLAGTWIERYGLNKSLLLLSVLNCLGQAVFSIGIGWRSFWITLIGRFIFGLGGECLAVAQARLVTDWFIGKELALALGMNLSIARVGTIVNNVMSAWLYETWGIKVAVWVGFMTCVVSLVCSLITIAIGGRNGPKQLLARAFVSYNEIVVDKKTILVPPPRLLFVLWSDHPIQ